MAFSDDNPSFQGSGVGLQVSRRAVKPFILIVHGAYCTPELWQPFISNLAAAGFGADCPRLPTCGNKKDPSKDSADARPTLATYDDDVKVVRKRALELMEGYRSIVVLAHSYGGVVAAEAIDPGLYAHTRAPDTGGVTQLLLLATWLPLKGNSMRDCLGLHGMKSECDISLNDDGTSTMKNAAYAFFNDVKPSTGAEKLAAATVTHNWMATTRKIQATPWVDLVTTYIHCTQDKSIWLELQKMMVKDMIMKERPVGFSVETLDTGHSPYLSSPEQLVDLLKNIATIT